MANNDDYNHYDNKNNKTTTRIEAIYTKEK
jgi:hypothetical protein